jgi:hypothetical protein
MKLVHRIVVATVLTWCPSAELALAEPISITSGVITIPEHSFEFADLTLSGTDGVRRFAFDGFISGISFGAQECRPCFPGGTDFSIHIPAFGAIRGDVTYGTESYRTGGSIVADEEGSLNLLILGRATLPSSLPAVGELATVTAPFTMTGHLVPPFSGGGRSNTLVGSGVATLQLFGDPIGDPVAAWAFRSGEYRFTSATDPGPVPEPATILLCGSGLALAVLRRRRKANRTNTWSSPASMGVVARRETRVEFRA